MLADVILSDLEAGFWAVGILLIGYLVGRQ
jgi:hypothetical protein